MYVSVLLSWSYSLLEYQSWSTSQQPTKIACCFYNHKYALELIAKGASVNVRSRLGETPLIYAADEGNYIVVNRIMMLGGILNLKDSQDRGLILN